MLSLPYLDQDGPDFFEVTGTNRQEEIPTEYISTNEDIISTSISMNDALEIINNKIGKTNFSSIAGQKQSQEERHKSFMFHYQRISSEIEELAQLIENDDDQSSAQLLHQLELSLQNILKMTSERSVPDLQAIQKKATGPYLSSQVKIESKSPRTSSEWSKILVLEKRLSWLENMIGAKSADLTQLMAKFKCTNVCELVERMQTALDLLDPQKSSEIETKLQNLDKKLKETAEMCKNTNFIKSLDLGNNSFNISLLAKRLISLKDLHLNASDFVELLGHLNLQFEQLSCTVCTQKCVLDTLSESVRNSAQAVQNNVTHLDEKIDLVRNSLP